MLEIFLFFQHKNSINFHESKIKKIPYKKAYSSIYEDMNFRHPSTTKLFKLINKTPRLNIDQILKKIIFN